MEPSRSITCYKDPTGGLNADLISAQNYLLGLLTSSGQQLSQEIQKTTQVTQEVIPQLQSSLEDLMNENTRLRKYIVVLESQEKQTKAADRQYIESLEQEITVLQQFLENTRKEFTEYKEKSENALKKAIESKDDAVQLVSETAEARLLAIKEQIKSLVGDTYIWGHRFDLSAIKDLRTSHQPQCSCHSQYDEYGFIKSFERQYEGCHNPLNSRVGMEARFRIELSSNLARLIEELQKISLNK